MVIEAAPALTYPLVFCTCPFPHPPTMSSFQVPSNQRTPRSFVAKYGVHMAQKDPAHVVHASAVHFIR